MNVRVSKWMPNPVYENTEDVENRVGRESSEATIKLI